MFVSLGGALGMNIHGKNNFCMGPIGEHVLEFELLTPTGEHILCSPTQNSALFYSAIGGFGMLGCFVKIRLQMKKVYSGQLSVTAISTPDFPTLFHEFEARMGGADYLVAWVDCFARGAKLGRSLIHQADYLPQGKDPIPTQTLRVRNQELPETLFGVFPKSLMWRLMKPFGNNFGMRLLNTAKYIQGSTLGNNKTYRQSHAAFAFLLDYVPNWKFVYKPGGLIQYQSFVPAETAQACFIAQLEACHQVGIVPYLGVFKRHRKDAFLMSHAVEGYSFALDFPITKRNRAELWRLTERLNQLVLEAGGRFYFAKDSTLTPSTAKTYLGENALNAFRTLKQQCDPNSILQTELSRRLFGAWEK
jgi:FAD/FMN-containing dehydrogenase